MIPQDTTPLMMLEKDYQSLDQNQYLINELSKITLNFNMTSLYGIEVLNDQIFTVNLQNNNLTGQFPSFIYFLRDLNGLNLSNNSLSGTMDSESLSYDNIVVINLSRNNISGSIPLLVTNIKELDLSYNNFQGYIPKLIKANNLTTLILSNNRITGVVPKYLVRQPSLNYLDLSYNRLVGYIPTLSQSFIRILLLNNNYIMDNITHSNILRSGALNYFNGDSNNIVGYLTNEMFDFTPFQYLSIRNNSQIKGVVPSVVSCIGDKINFTSDVNTSIPCKPTIISITDLDTNGGPFTIYGKDFGNQENSFYIDITLENGIKCTDINIVRINSIIECMGPPGFGTHTLTFKFRNTTITKQYKYKMPNVLEISTVTKESGGRITINGNDFYTKPNISLIVEIGGQKCTNITVNSPNQLQCDLGSSNLKIPAPINITVDNQYSVSNQVFFYYTAVDSVFECTRPCDNRGSINITSSVINLSSTIKVRVGDYFEPCNNLIIHNNNSINNQLPVVISCIPPLGNGLNHSVFVTVDSVTYHSRCLSYNPPIIYRVSGADYTLGGIVKVYGNHLSAEIEQLNIKIGNRTCKPLAQSNEHQIQCFIESSEQEEMNQQISVTISNQTSKSVYSDIDERCIDFCNEHSNRCRSGACECYSNWNGPFCESEVNQPEFDLDPNYPCLTFRYKSFQLSHHFKVELAEISEVTPSGKIVEPLLHDRNWQLNFTRADKVFVYTTPKHNIHVEMMCACDGDKEVWYAGEYVHLPRYTVRYTVRNFGHRFHSPENKLRVTFDVTSPPPLLANHCSAYPIIETSTIGKLRWFTSYFYDMKLFGRVSQRVVLDNMIRAVDSEMRQPKDNPFLLHFDYLIDAYSESMHIESDFSTLAKFRGHPEYNNEGCFVDRTNLRKPYEFIGAIIVILGSVALLIYLTRVDSHHTKQSLQLNKVIMAKDISTPVMTSVSAQSYQSYLESIIDSLTIDNLGSPICPLNGTNFILNQRFNQLSNGQLLFGDEDDDEDEDEDDHENYEDNNIELNNNNININNININNNNNTSNSSTNTSGISTDDLNQFETDVIRT